MAPAKVFGESLDLAKCLTGEQQLLSWEAAYVALCDPETAGPSKPVYRFFNTNEHVLALYKPWQPFPPPSADEKAKFESRTAPINAPSSADGAHSLEEIKADSLWLSQLVNISEDAALRLVVLEWQSRPTVQLLSGLTEEEALSVNDAAGLANLGASTFVPNSTLVTAPLGIADTEFDQPDQRKLRILQAYFSARVFILRTCQLLVSWGGANQLKQPYGQKHPMCTHVWIKNLCEQIPSVQGENGASLDQIIRAADERWDLIDAGFTWDVPESIQEAAVELWLTTQVTEVIYLLLLAIHHADLYTERDVFAPAAIVELWFNSVGMKDFFRNLVLPLPDQQHLVPLIQLLTSHLSLAVLKVDVVLDHLESGQYDSWDPSCYLLSGSVLETVTNVFGYAKALGPSPATPPAFAWSIITYRLTARASEIEQMRDDQIQSGSGESPQEHTALEEAALALSRLESSDLFDKKMPYQDLAESCSNFGVLEIITQLVNLGMSSFGTPIDRVTRDSFRLLLFQLIRSALSSGVVEYTPELIICVHAIMTGDRTFRRWVRQDTRRLVDPITTFCLNDEAVMRPLLIDEARSRYPYELVPLLKFFSAITRGEGLTADLLPPAANILSTMSTLMQQLPPGFQGYSSIREEENANWISLSEELPQFGTNISSSFHGTRRLMSSNNHIQSEYSMVIPPSTEGNMVDDTPDRPFVAVWYYPHSALEYLVRLLSTFVVGSNTVEFSSQQPVSLENATEIIGFFADLLHASLQTKDHVTSPELLDAMDMGVDRSQDSVNIILAIFDQVLLAQCREPGNGESLELLVSCIRYLQALVRIAPNRVWPWLTRSRLLATEGNGGGLANVLIGTEIPLGRYDFLIGCIELFRALIEDAVSQSIARKSLSKSLTRFQTATTHESGTSDKVMGSTLLTFGRSLASIYEGSLNWKFLRPEDRLEINIGICGAFNTILTWAYGVDDSIALSSKITGLIAPLAEYLTDLYLPGSENDPPTNPVLTSLLSGAGGDKSPFLTNSAALWQKQTQTALVFSNTLVRVAVLLNKPWTHLEQQLFKATPLLARLYATSDNYKSPVVILLETLVRGAMRVVQESEPDRHVNSGKSGQSEPPSLLGHLGPRTAKNFLSILSRLDEPLRIADFQIKVWNLLSAVVTCKQQWFSLYLLTGTTPRESIKSKATAGSNPLRSKALLSRALDTLTKLDLDQPDNDWGLYSAMLEFVSSAQNHWSWAIGGIKQHKGFIDKLLAFLKWAPLQDPDMRIPKGATTRSYLNTFSSLTCEVLAMYLHGARQIGDVAPLKEVAPILKYLGEEALRLPSYNAALHSKLKQNFEKQFKGVSISNLKRTTLFPVSFGMAFFYDINLGDTILRFSKTWLGPDGKGQGLSGDVITANLNLGLVESQIQLLRSWKLLAVELSNDVGKDASLVSTLIKVVKDSMSTNAESTLPEALFGQLKLLRVDLSFVLLQKMTYARTNTPEARALLDPIWKAIRASTSDFDTAFSDDGVDYYRSLLRILYLALQFHLVDESASAEDTSLRSSFRGSIATSNKQALVEPISNQLLEILSDVVAKGFRSLATQLHSEPGSVSPSDFALLTAILQTVLSIPEMTPWHAQAALLFSNNNTLRYATSLFSWSDRLTIPNNGVDDPVYGELSLLFILSLSTMQSLAEAMAVEGILSQLNTANLMNYYRRPGGMSPFDAPVRLFSIWTKGILPLCLNLLRAVGPAIAGEISAFLNQFPEQLNRASDALNCRRTSTKVTLSIASEAHSLALISSILESDRAQGPRLGIQASDIPALDWDRENVKEDIESWMARKGALRERIVVADERDSALFAKKSQGDGAENMLEERVLRELDAAGDCLGLGKGNGS